MDNRALANTLRKMAEEIEKFRPSIVGQQIAVSSDGSGNVIGQVVSVTAKAGSVGNVTGLKIDVTAGPRDPEELGLAQDLQQQAAKVEAGEVDKSSIGALMKKAGTVASAGVTAVTRGVVSALLGS